MPQADLPRWPLSFLLTFIISLQTHPFGRTTLAFPAFASGSVSLHYIAGVLEIVKLIILPHGAETMKLHLDLTHRLAHFPEILDLELDEETGLGFGSSALGKG